MTLSTAAQATLLLTSYFSKPAKGAAKPLTPTEWGRFAQWLHETNHTPGDLLSHAAPWVLGKWSDEKIPRDRLEALLQRGSSMALAMEKWQRSGLWVITRSDPEYPRRLKKRLKHAAPPVLYGCGDAELLNAGGLAVVGSRKAGNDDLTYARKLGAKAAQAATGIVSGGARGIDEAAMQGAVQEGGPVIGILSEGLLKAATSSQWRQGLMNGGLVLVSPYYPEAGFNAGNAMGRNKYIYCLADAAVVVHSGSSGGTKAGAEENLKKGWVTLWVKPSQDPEAGNQQLVSAGGDWCAQEVDQLEIQALFTLPQPSSVTESSADDQTISAAESPADNGDSESTAELPQADLFGAVNAPLENLQQPKPESAFEPTPEGQTEEEAGQTAAPEATATGSMDAAADPAEQEPDARSSQAPWQVGGIDFYQLFLRELQRFAQSPRTVDEIVADTGLQKSQVNTWLKQAVEEQRAEKLTRPVRYLAIPETADPTENDVEGHVRRLRAPRTFETSS
ncbi:DNA-processing protein DprA [Halomonas sp. 11-S5]|uniref:DNA-processing protein DprA n=1 Tax=Halomonas sp. 11-S5 TaxID=2994064 RepID=UPI002468FC48|nr:DNA-processing protein DprA [Halomonas sp. 11-S5]